MPRVMLAAMLGLCAIALTLAVLLGVGLYHLDDPRPAIPVAIKPPPLRPPASSQPAERPPTTHPATRPATVPPAPAKKRIEIAKAPPAASRAKPAPPQRVAPPASPAVMQDLTTAWRDALLDPATSTERRREAVVQLARTEAGAAVLLQLTENGRLSAALQQFAVDRLYQNAASLAGDGMFAP